MPPPSERIAHFLRENWVTLLILVGLPLAWLTLRSPGTPLGSVDEFEQSLRTGQPTVVDFFSNG